MSEGLTMNQLAEINAKLRTKNERLLEKCNALAAEVQAVRWACGQVYMKGYNHGHLNTVDGLRHASDTDLVIRGGETLDEFTDPDHCGVAADAILDEVRAQGVDSALKVMGGFTSDECGDSVYIAVKELAAQLRQGAAQ